MAIVSTILTCLVALIHAYILWFEMFAWESRGPKVFTGFPKDLFPPTKQMAANQGLYNGFLAAGLIWAVLVDEPNWQANIALFFLACVAIAGIFGAVTASRKTLYVQTAPAVLAAIAILLGL